MAEARSASLVLQNKRGFRMGLSRDDESYDITISIPHPRNVGRAVVRSAARARNTIVNALFPARPWIMAGVVALVVAVVVTADRNSWWRSGFLAHMLWAIDSYVGFFFLPLAVRVGILAAEAAVVGFILLMYLQRGLLRLLLSYKGWLYQPPRSVSYAVMAWVAVVRLLSGRQPLMYSFQGALPRLPVPPVRTTCERYLETVRALLSEEELEKVKADMGVFLAKEAPKLQWYLVLKSWFKANYVTDWWEKFVYHRGRDSIMINSNYYILDCSSGVPTPHQLARAATLCCQFVKFKRQLDHESLDPMLIRDTVPLCMHQYRRMFSTTRLPAREIDTLQQTEWAKHIAVLCRGMWFRVDLFDSRHQPLDGAQIEKLLGQVSTMAEGSPAPSDEEASIAALTAGNRVTWADARERDFSDGVNMASLEVIERAMFVLVLEDGDPPLTWTERGHSLLHGSGTNRWFDKTLTLVVYTNGHAGLNAEHSWADAPVVAHMWESCVAEEMMVGNCYDARGHCLPSDSPGKGRIAVPFRLLWDLSAECRASINAAKAAALIAISDLQLEVFAHTAYGKGFIKKCRVSPDAFIQLALQLAYFTDAGEFALTYEASMTRLFRHGRTETVRSLSSESCAFVRKFSEAKFRDGVKSAADRKELVAMLRAATDVHQQKYRDAMSGKGVDRHLFALYVVAKGRNMSSNFLNNALSMPWKLSTSQQPQVQTRKWPAVKKGIKSGLVHWWDDQGNKVEGGPPSIYNVFSPGGGFGPVADDGYGVSYMVTGEDRIYFHVSCKRSSDRTNSERFRAHVLESFRKLRALFDDGAQD